MVAKTVIRGKNIQKEVRGDRKVPNYQIQIYERLKGLQYVDHPIFKDKEAENLLSYDLFSDPNAFVSKSKPLYYNEDLASYSSSLKDFHVLKTAAEQKLFLKYNYAKCIAHSLLDHLDTHKDFVKAEHYLNVARETRDLLIVHNLRLVIAVVKDFRPSRKKSFDDHLSDGNESVMKAVEKFDVSRGYKFSTYLVYSIKMNHWKYNKTRKKDIPSPLSIADEFAEQAIPAKYIDPLYNIALADHIKAVIDTMNTCLTAKERGIILGRFGIHGAEPKTLITIGNELGCTRERVRQIQVKALATLREILTVQ